jgi:hypothetical protein
VSVTTGNGGSMCHYLNEVEFEVQLTGSKQPLMDSMILLVMAYFREDVRSVIHFDKV